MNDLQKIQAKLDKPQDVIYLSKKELASVIGFFPQASRQAAFHELRKRDQEEIPS